ncbi:methyl-accepting chemotaxis protein [Paenibacillus xylanexedens]|uniref:Methyl-accepting chemotaxis protein n=1 Tax=Paenibacillus xylanexedens TaxID=528191 RepID=A0ABS4RUT6_PAEXY|nr:methyl-accepting chemotaxis protein [Paenibacillus xylanexedens]MBP2246640.1 methyl-accepting chemotaxis protein [Paenibacillus xylanexedens]
MKFKKKIGTVRNRLVASFLIVLLLPSLVIGGFAYLTAKQQVDTQLANMADTDISLVSSMVNQYIQAKQSDVGLLAESITSTNPEAALKAYTNNHSEVESAIFVKSDGQHVYASSSQSQPDNDKPLESEFYTKAIAVPGQVVLTEPFTSKQSGNTVMTLAKASSDSKSVVAVTLDLSALQETVGKIKIGDNGFVIIFSANGSMIVNPPWGTEGSQGEDAKIGDAAPLNSSSDAEQDNSQGDGGPGTTMFEGDSGQIEQSSPEGEGETRKLVYITNQLTGWKIAGDRSPIEVVQAAKPIWNNTLMVIAVFALLGIGMTILIVRSITKPLKTLNDVSGEVSRGDLSRIAAIHSNDELGQLGDAFNLMVGSLNSIVSEVKNSSNQLVAASEQLSANAGQSATATGHIAATIEQMAEGTDRQVVLVEESLRTIHHVAEQIGHIANNASATAIATEQVAEKSKEGGQAINGAVTQMGTIHHSVNRVSDGINHLVQTSLEIGQIIKVISDISRQTNLLALNASIEAARAGEHGKGFAVVAREVGALAEQAADSAKQVTTLIGSINEGIQHADQSMVEAIGEVSKGMNVMNTAGQLFDEITLSVDTVNSKANEVSTMADDIVQETSHVVAKIEDISHVSRETAEGAQTVSAATEQQLASMQEISSSSSYLARMASRLQELTEKFKI